MWERSARHNPLSARYQMYKDNRPVLPQDRTSDWLIPRHEFYKMYYYYMTIAGKKKYLCSNNLPVHDRLTLQTLLEFRNYLNKYLKYAGVFPTVFFSAILFKKLKLPYKILYPITFYLIYKLNHAFLIGYSDHFYYQNFSYFYHKYAHLAVDRLEEVKDPKRQHFRLDTDSYYRQSAQEILHGSHGHPEDDGGQEAHHDTSTYYGPYPYNDFENLDHVVEINKKFTTGKSKFDNPANEYLLGDRVDVPRVVATIPTVEDYRSI